MTWPVFRRVMRTQRLTVVLFVLLGLVAGAAYSFLKAPAYSATSQLFVTLDLAGNELATEDDGVLYVQERLLTYARITTSRPVMLDVKRRMSLDIDTETLASRIRVTQPEATTLLDIEVRESSPERARQLAQATADAAQKLLPGLEIPSDAGSSLRATVVRPAVADPAPMAPVRNLDIALGLLAGLATGLAAGALRSRFDSTVRSADELQVLTGTAPLGVLPFDERSTPRGRAQEGDRSGHGEALRAVRSNLRFMAGGSGPPRFIVVTSPLPRDGRTRTACDLAMMLATTGARVALVDADLRSAGLGETLGVGNAAGLTSVLAGVHSLGEATIPYDVLELDVLPCGPRPPNPAELLGSRQAAAVFDELRARYDYVVMDTPSLQVTDASVLARSADVVVMVVRHGRTRRADVVRALELLGSVGEVPVRTVLNAIPPGLEPGAGVSPPHTETTSGGMSFR